MTNFSEVPKRVLLIDDDEDILVAVRSFLESEGFEVVTAVNGQEALIMLLQNEISIDLILLDLYMPRMNGWQFSFYLRKNGSEEHKKIPIIISSAIEASAGKDASFGFDGFLQKPFKKDDLVETCRQFFPVTA